MSSRVVGQARTSAGELRGGHVLAALIAFFAAVIAVDVGFSVMAVRTFPGEDVKHSYLQGLHYNDTLQERSRERALGWTSAVGIAGDGADAHIVVDLAQASAAPIIDADVQASLRRPATAKDDHTLHFQHVGAGKYEASVRDLAPGVWVIQGVATRDGTEFHFERRLEWRLTP